MKPLNKRWIVLFFTIACTILLAQTLTGYEDAGHVRSLPSPDSLPVYGYSVVNVFPHDSDAFTQGLIYEHNVLYEGTGLYAGSSLRKVVLETGAILKIYYLDSSYFGEGITMWNDTIVQITWREHTGFVYIEQDTFEVIDSFSYTTEGWGLTHDDTCLIMSDGSSTIYYLDPHTYVVVDSIGVEAEGVPINNLNELEYIQGKIYANVWYHDSIAIIDPGTGNISAWLDLSALAAGQPNVLNGIAYDRDDVRLFVTGKLWSELYEIEVEPLNYPPEITSYDPPSPCYIDIDSLLVLTVAVQDPDPEDSLVYTWSINGAVDTMAHDTSYDYSSSIVTVDTIMFKADDGMFADSVIWIVNVRDPGAIVEDHHISVNSGVSLACVPNPFKREVMISFKKRQGTAHIDQNINNIRLKIYDAGGRLIKQWFYPVLKQPHSISWNGTDQHGDLVPAGFYFIGLDTGEAMIWEHIIRLK
jgi:glutamine cyclotransferase